MFDKICGTYEYTKRQPWNPHGKTDAFGIIFSSLLGFGELWHTKNANKTIIERPCGGDDCRKYLNSNAIGLDSLFQTTEKTFLWETLFIDQLHIFRYHPHIHFLTTF